MATPFLTQRELARAWQIVTVIGRYGLAPLAQAMGLGGWLGVRLWQHMDRRLRDVTPPVRLRLALVELGTTFIKLGQVLSARSDLLPPEYLEELSRLQDDVPPLPFPEMEGVFREEFGLAPAEAFAAFDSAPLASASIGQVYQAVTHDGERVVVKIQRPGVLKQVQTDLALLRRAAAYANNRGSLERYDLPALVREFSAILEDELLYTLEAYNAETLMNESIEAPHVRFPLVVWRYTSRRVLTTHHEEGIKITHVTALDAAGVDRKAVAVTLANALLEQIFLYGMFHGDPHPGNLLVTTEGTVIFLDTGMVGRLDRRMREVLIELAVSIFDQDIDAIVTHLQQIGVVSEVAFLPGLRRDMARLITKYYFMPRRELRLGELLQRVNALLFEHHIRMAYEFSLMAKALFLVEGIAQRLDPDFDYNRAARPVIEKVRYQYYSPRVFVEDTMREFRGLRRQIVDLPRRLNTVITQLEHFSPTIRLKDELFDLKDAEEQVLVNRIAFAILTIGLLLASALLLGNNPTGWIAYIATGALVVDALFILILLISVLRSGRF